MIIQQVSRMGLYQHNAVSAVLPRHVLEELPAHGEVLAKRLRQQERHRLFLRRCPFQRRLQRVLIGDEQARDRLLCVRIQSGRKLLARHLLHLRDGIVQRGDVIDLHIDAIAPVPVLNENKAPRRHPCLQAKMPPVVVPGGVVIPDAVQSVLHGVVADSVPTEVIADGIRIAEDVDVLILPEVHRNVLLLQPGELPAEFHAVDEIPGEGPRIFLQGQELREKGVGLFIEPYNLFKNTALPRPHIQIAEIVRHPREYERRSTPLLLWKVQLLQAGDVCMIEGMANVNPELWHSARILSR